MKRTHVSQAFYGSPWPLHPPKLREIETVIRSRFFVQAGAGRPKRVKLPAAMVDEDLTEAVKAQNGDRPYFMLGRVAVLPMMGVISQRMNMLTYFSGGTSTELFGRAFAAAVADGDVSTIVIDCDSPGGCVYGVPELAAQVYAGRGQKRVVAVVNSMMASAAYWIGSAASEIVLTPSGHVGSIGVYIMHEDYTEAEKMAGIKTSFIYAGKYKVEGNPFEPLGDDARAAIQADVDHYYTLFVNAVAKHRGTTADAVRNGYGEGRVLNSSDAISAGLVDRIATFDQVLTNERKSADTNPLMTMKRRQALAELQALDA